MTARACGVYPAMVDDRDHAFKGIADGISGLDVVPHILVATLGPAEGTIEGVYSHHDRRMLAHLRLDGGDELPMVLEQVQGAADQIKGHWVTAIAQEPSAERFYSSREALPAL